MNQSAELQTNGDEVIDLEEQVAHVIEAGANLVPPSPRPPSKTVSKRTCTAEH